MHNRDPRTDDDLKEGVQDVEISVSWAEIRQATKNVIFFIVGSRLRVDESRFQHFV